MVSEVISATLFHFTKQKDVFEKILTNGLRLSYSYEALPGKGGYLVPMICFCDIPLQHIGYHTCTYGQFGIGFSKDYMRQKSKFCHVLNPVLYSVSKNMTKAIDDFLSVPEVLEDLNVSLMEQFVHAKMCAPQQEQDVTFEKFIKTFGVCCSANFMIGYWKPYDDGGSKNYYQEREWRIVLPKGHPTFGWQKEETKPEDKIIREFSSEIFDNQGCFYELTYYGFSICR